MDSRVATNARLALGTALVHFGKSSQALPLFSDALRSARDLAHDPDLQEDAEIGLSEVENNLNHLDAARAHNREALRLARMLKGENHPDVAANLLTANEFDVLAGRYSEAATETEEAWRIENTWLGPEHPETIDAQRILGQDYGYLHRYADAVHTLRSALAVEQRTRPEPHRQLALLLADLAMAEARLNQDDAARAHYLQALEMYRSIYAGTDYKIGVTLTNLAVMDEKKNHLALAESEARQAVEMLVRTLPPGHTRLDFAEGHLGQILAKEHKDTEAAHFMMLAYTGLQAQTQPPRESLENLRFNLHALFVRMGDPVRTAQFQPR